MFAKTAKQKQDKTNLIATGTEMQAAGRKNYETIGPDQSNHCHSTAEKEETKVDTSARRKLLIASGLCLVFMTGEIIGGALANSLAIMTDAAHLLTDFASFMISLLAIYLAARPATKAMSFGWHRAEVVGALISVLLIWVVTGVLFYLAVERVVQRNFEVDGKIMLITSSIGVVVNMIMAVTLHQHGHTHGGGSAHSHGGGDGGDSAHQTPSHTEASSGASTPTRRTPPKASASCARPGAESGTSSRSARSPSSWRSTTRRWRGATCAGTPSSPRLT
ncbi:hypothetical protein BOX15_Mlig032168g1 [Macrostomum lignano]|uniref:Cation efflux protein transmembrane domain-containing protein n=1 Tax=Macrostomum lignano TaxID=282301 RepID=A0A267GZC3_9PLAT|nr:hypothetical protein BOX15_Mlig032168g1 [Macrostomum lignano]